MNSSINLQRKKTYEKQFRRVAELAMKTKTKYKNSSKLSKKKKIDDILERLVTMNPKFGRKYIGKLDTEYRFQTEYMMQFN